MAICGPNNVFYAVNISWPGSVHASKVLKNSAVFLRFEEGWYPFPRAIILGNNVYLKKSRPLRRNPDQENEIGFNRHHKRVRKTIEAWLNYLRVQPQKSVKFVLAICILHNAAETVDREDEHVEIGIDFDGEFVKEESHDKDHLHEKPVNLAAESRMNQLLQFFIKLKSDYCIHIHYHYRIRHCKFFGIVGLC
ncbi:hypothetical protein FQR65_LT03003 [Abscondita terminalis]|nr:hypothetical protein FQR65_LT03003 [Abscondita terminalis]